MSNPKASFVMGVFNKQAFLSQAIHSILHQSEKNIELVIVDDASYDYSEDVYRHYEKKDKRVRVFKNEHNKGVSYTYNRATAESKGDVIIVAAADDVYSVDRAKWSCQILKKKPDVDIVYFPFEKGEYDLKVFEKKTAPKFDINVLKQVNGQFIGHGFTSYRRKVGETVKYREELKCGCDHAFFLDCWKAGFKFYNVDDMTKLAGVYRFYPKMVSIQRRDIIVSQDVELLKEYAEAK